MSIDLQAAAPYAETDLLHLLMLAEGAATDLRESRQPHGTPQAGADQHHPGTRLVPGRGHDRDQASTPGSAAR